MLFNEPKLLKSPTGVPDRDSVTRVSVLFNEPKLLKFSEKIVFKKFNNVSVLFNEPKLLKSCSARGRGRSCTRFQCSSTSRNC